MFENLTNRFTKVFNELRRHGKLSESDVDSALRDVRIALLEADVQYGVVQSFVSTLKNRMVGQEVSRALNPAQQVIKIVDEELVSVLGEPSRLNLTGDKPHVLMMVGLQGAGKTTTAGKLAKKLRINGERVLLVAADPYRPAAIQQLQILGEQIGVEVYADTKLNPPKLVKKAVEKAKKGGYSVVIIDTAGRSQLDNSLMDELKSIAKISRPKEIILIVDGMIGQEAVNIAQGFRKSVDISGLILTKMDGDARGGAAISIRSVSGLPIKYLGVGEDLDGIEQFDPKRLASRILGMGDIVGLVEKAEANLDMDEAAASSEKMLSGNFTLEDFADQLKQMKKMGPIGQLMGMLPGNMTGGIMSQADSQQAERNLISIEAIINSMTPGERIKPKNINASRKRRIANGSGTQVQDVNRLLKQHRDMQKMMKRMKKSGMRGFPGMSI